MVLVKKGNLVMMRPLFDRYHTRIYMYVHKLTRDDEVSRDITQDVFYKVIKYKDSFNQANFSAWIYTIAKNLCKDHFSKCAKEKFILDGALLTLEEVKEEHNGDQLQRLDSALQKLSFSDRELIIMSRYQGLMYKEIAEITQSTEGAVKTKVHRALGKLKEHFFKKKRYDG